MAKEFAWSFSRLKNYEDCPRRYYEIDVQRNYKEEIKPGSPLYEGNQVHDVLAKACSGAEPLPPDRAYLQPWVDKVQSWEGGRLLVEQKYAITRLLQPTTYFAPNVWYRGIGDVVWLAPPVAIILDWKTGGIKPDSVQLMLMAQCVLSHFPDIQRVGSMFVWLKEDETTQEYYGREELQAVWTEGLLARAARLEQAHKDKNFPPHPSGLCKTYCRVQSCPHWKKG